MDKASLKLKNILRCGRNDLAAAGIDDIRLELVWMVEAASGWTQTEQILYIDKSLEPEVAAKIKEMIKERCQRKPLAYILGESYFYGRPFYVNEAVIVPRSDTEILVEEAIEQLRKRFSSEDSLNILDTCTGSGCIALTIYLELVKQYPKISLDLVDNSMNAIKVAKANAARHLLETKRIQFYVNDIWPQKNIKYDVITCNPPYIEEDDFANLMPEVSRYEPRNALVAEKNGLYFYHRFAREAKDYLKTNALLILEHGYDQRESIIKIFSDSGLKLLMSKNDYASNPRLLLFQKAT